ncbi:MAG: NAD(P)H-dependent oxidoreductase [Bacteroidota bacterium]
MNIQIISGSPREKSVTNRVAIFLKNYLSQHTSHEVGIIDVRDYQLPLLQEVWTSVDKAPPEFRQLATTMFEADAFILVSPEYNGSYSPAMKNLLDQFPKQNRKAFGIVTASPGAMGGIRASQQMQLLVGALFGILAPNMLITPFVDKKFDADGNLTDVEFQKAINVFIKEFTWLAESVNAKLQPIYN